MVDSKTPAVSLNELRALLKFILIRLKDDEWDIRKPASYNYILREVHRTGVFSDETDLRNL